MNNLTRWVTGEDVGFDEQLEARKKELVECRLIWFDYDDSDVVTLDEFLKENVGSPKQFKKPENRQKKIDKLTKYWQELRPILFKPVDTDDG